MIICKSCQKQIYPSPDDDDSWFDDNGTNICSEELVEQRIGDFVECAWNEEIFTFTMNQYQETLNKWATRFVPEGAKIVSVNVTYDDGIDPTFTDHEPSLTGSIDYVHNDLNLTRDLDPEEIGHMGELLTELFMLDGLDD